MTVDVHLPLARRVGLGQLLGGDLQEQFPVLLGRQLPAPASTCLDMLGPSWAWNRAPEASGLGGFPATSVIVTKSQTTRILGQGCYRPRPDLTPLRIQRVAACDRPVE